LPVGLRAMPKSLEVAITLDEIIIHLRAILADPDPARQLVLVRNLKARGGDEVVADLLGEQSLSVHRSVRGT